MDDLEEDEQVVRFRCHCGNPRCPANARIAELDAENARLRAELAGVVGLSPGASEPAAPHGEPRGNIVHEFFAVGYVKARRIAEELVVRNPDDAALPETERMAFWLRRILDNGQRDACWELILAAKAQEAKRQAEREPAASPTYPPCPTCGKPQVLLGRTIGFGPDNYACINSACPEFYPPAAEPMQ